MKKISLLLFFAACKLFSQTSIQLTNMVTSATLAPNTVITATTMAGGNTQHSIDIKNVSVSTKTIIIKRYDILLFANGTSTAFAASNCLSPYTFTYSFQLAAGQNASQNYNYLWAQLFEADAVGHSIVKYTFFNTSTLSDSSQITFNFNPPTSLYEQLSSFSSFELFPNPVNEKGTININSEITSEGKLFIYNALGTMMNERSILLTKGKNKLDFNAENLPSGIYFMSFKFGVSEITRKFMVN